METKRFGCEAVLVRASGQLINVSFMELDGTPELVLTRSAKTAHPVVVRDAQPFAATFLTRRFCDALRMDADAKAYETAKLYDLVEKVRERLGDARATAILAELRTVSANGTPKRSAMRTLPEHATHQFRREPAKAKELARLIVKRYSQPAQG